MSRSFLNIQIKLDVNDINFNFLKSYDSTTTLKFFEGLPHLAAEPQTANKSTVKSGWQRCPHTQIWYNTCPFYRV